MSDIYDEVHALINIKCSRFSLLCGHFVYLQWMAHQV